MSLTQWITEVFQQYAYQPEIVYLLVISLMALSSFGLPLPEEIIIVTTSLLAYMAMNPSDYPPPYEGAVGVNVYVLMAVCFFAVFFGDCIVFFIGRRLGRNMHEKKWFQRLIKPEAYRKVKFWTQKYGVSAAAIFRFLPGIRFPGHLACGALGIPPWKFLVVDSCVILISIPTQVYLISHYGDVIINFIEKYRYLVVVLFLMVLVYFAFLIYKNMNYVKQKKLLRSLKKLKLDSLKK